MSDIVRSAEQRVSRRREVMQVLRAAAAPMSIAAIADELDVHPNTVRFHLDILVRDGRVESVEPGRGGPGRPPLMFRAVREMDHGGPRRYQLLAEILSMGFAADRDPSAKALATGRAWGQRLEPRSATTKSAGSAEESIDHLIEVLDELGFAPERRELGGQQQVGLRHCPFLEVAEARTAIVCPIHLGIMQGALENWNAPVSVDRLDPWTEPDLCLAHLVEVASR